MTPVEPDLKVVRERLGVVSESLAGLRRLPAGSREELLSDFRNVPTVDSLLRRGLEALFDVARHLLSRGFGHGALEYRQVARMAGREGLVRDSELAARFEKIAGYRNRLTHHYEEVAVDELLSILQDHLDDLDRIGEELRLAAERLVSSS